MQMCAIVVCSWSGYAVPDHRRFADKIFLDVDDLHRRKSQTSSVDPNETPIAETWMKLIDDNSGAMLHQYSGVIHCCILFKQSLCRQETANPNAVCIYRV
jgi:hypothetical protein